MSWRAVVVVALSVLFLAIVAPTIFARFPTAYMGALDPDEAAVLEALAESASQAYVRVENSRLRALVGSGLQPSAS